MLRRKILKALLPPLSESDIRSCPREATLTAASRFFPGQNLAAGGRNGRAGRLDVPADDFRGKISYFSFVVAAANTDSFSAVSLKRRYTEIVYPASPSCGTRTQAEGIYKYRGENGNH